MNDHIIIPNDRTAVIDTPEGKYVFWYDENKKQVIIQATTRGDFFVAPRAGNSIGLGIHKVSA